MKPITFNNMPTMKNLKSGKPSLKKNPSVNAAIRAWTRIWWGLASLILSLPLFAQYAIPWHTIDGGGGTSTGGVYSVSGTIGQPDAGGPMTGGNYSLTGGFWALPQAVPTPGAPQLTIVPANPGFATISWSPATGTNWVLQEALAVSGAWTNSPSGWTNPVVLPATLPTKYYRLFKP